ncbi:MAG TPA: hypothetical protein PKO15_04570 [Fibrobacteria bacterium]|nr:hypothetical protein [Fibrobacteria bacterium]HOX50013.1 hypothetical protein [Fibrobacteria bacterium]
MNPRGIQRAIWNETAIGKDPDAVDRWYFGHETCATRAIASLTNSVTVGDGIPCTFVSPCFVSDSDMVSILRRVEALGKSMPVDEIVCNDWGMVETVGRNGIARPVLGRLLSGQITDPRVARWPEGSCPSGRTTPIRLPDGKLGVLRGRPIPAELAERIRSIPSADASFLDWLARLGVRRIEFSNVLQGLSLPASLQASATLHCSDVVVSVSRTCRPHPDGELRSPGFPVPLQAIDNVLRYRSGILHPGSDHPAIDRLVFRSSVNAPCNPTCTNFTTQESPLDATGTCPEGIWDGSHPTEHPWQRTQPENRKP